MLIVPFIASFGKVVLPTPVMNAGSTALVFSSVVEHCYFTRSRVRAENLDGNLGRPLGNIDPVRR